MNKFLPLITLLAFALIWDDRSLANGHRMYIVGEEGTAEGVRPGPGMFLVATNEMPDHRFRQTVVLITAHNEKGTAGIVINKPTKILLSEVFPKSNVFRNIDGPLNYGGPVAPYVFVALIKATGKPEKSDHVFRDIYITGHMKSIESMISENKDLLGFRGFAGYAGWSSGQLDSELMAGGWKLMSADSFSIFIRDPALIWSDLMKKSKVKQWI